MGSSKNDIKYYEKKRGNFIMKKLLLGVAVLSLAFAFSACSTKETEDTTGGSEVVTEAEVEAETEAEGETVEAESVEDETVEGESVEDESEAESAEDETAEGETEADVEIVTEADAEATTAA